MAEPFGFSPPSVTNETCRTTYSIGEAMRTSAAVARSVPSTVQSTTSVPTLGAPVMLPTLDAVDAPATCRSCIILFDHISGASRSSCCALSWNSGTSLAHVHAYVLGEQVSVQVAIPSVVGCFLWLNLACRDRAAVFRVSASKTRRRCTLATCSWVITAGPPVRERRRRC